MIKQHPSLIVATTFCLLLVLSSSFPAITVAAEEGDLGLPDATLEIQDELKTGNSIRVVFNLNGYDIPSGSYASIKVSTLKSPSNEQPVVKTGYPTTSLMFTTPGTYQLRFVLNETSKPSCGGVNAKLLMEATRTLKVIQ